MLEDNGRWRWSSMVMDACRSWVRGSRIWLLRMDNGGGRHPRNVRLFFEQYRIFSSPR
jgi:hypothetical protein